MSRVRPPSNHKHRCLRITYRLGLRGSASWDTLVSAGDISSALAILLGSVSQSISILPKYRSRPIRILKSRRAIRDYMIEWIKNAGAVAIFSRDLSWVDDAEIGALLEAKARNGDLTLILPKEVSLSEQLVSLGAKALYYPSIDDVIRSRFTLVKVGRSDTRVAIGCTEGTIHRYRRILAGDHRVFYLADDMLQLMQKSARKAYMEDKGTPRMVPPKGLERIARDGGGGDCP